MENKLLGLICCVLVASCATSSKPFSYFFEGGYREVQLAENVFKITVEANGYTSSEQARDLALIRSADVTTQHGFKYFVIGAPSDNSYSSSYPTPTTTNNVTGHGNTISGTTQTYDVQTFIFRFPTPTMTITCFKEKPTSQATIYEAELVSKSLRAQFEIN